MKKTPALSKSNLLHVATLALIFGIPMLKAESPLDRLNPETSIQVFDQMVEEKYKALSENFEANPYFKNSGANLLRDGVKSPFVTEFYDIEYYNNARPYTERELRNVNEYRMLPYEVFRQAMVGYFNVIYKKPTEMKTKSLLTVVNFDEPTNTRRFYVFDLEKNVVLFNTFVAHGYTSDADRDRVPEIFSNTPGSKNSSLGFYFTANSNGPTPSFRYANRVEGIDGELNNKARSRAILIHEWGQMEVGSMWPNNRPATEGCFGLPAYDSGRFYGLEDRPLNDLIQDTIVGKSLIYAHSTVQDLPSLSLYLDTEKAAMVYEASTGFDGSRNKFERELKRRTRRGDRDAFLAERILEARRAREAEAAATPAPSPSPSPSPSSEPEMTPPELPACPTSPAMVRNPETGECELDPNVYPADHPLRRFYEWLARIRARQ